MSNLPNGSYVYTGAWVDWSYGSIVGATLTLSERDGSLLTSFIAAFVTLVGAQGWRILSFAFHQLRSSGGPQDGIFHQQQTIFRNVSTPGGAAWSFIQQWWAWRHTERSRAFLRIFPWAFLATAYVLLFAALATFSAETSKAATDDRLVRSNHCGYWAFDTNAVGEVTDQGFFASRQTFANDSVTAANYANSCYRENPDQLACNTYVVPSLPWESEHVACPFADSICMKGVPAFQMRSKLIDSHKDLGINAPQRERVQFQKTTTCAPLVTEGYAELKNGSEISAELTGTQYVFYNYGSVGSTNWTYLYSLDAVHSGFAYNLYAYMSLGGTNDNAWLPIDALSEQNVDLSIMFISSNSVQYIDKVVDPVFAASSLPPPDALGVQSPYYSPDRWVTPVACAEVYQFCNPVNGVCSPIGPYFSFFEDVEYGWWPNNGLSKIQIETLQRILWVGWRTNMYSATWTRGASALRALETLEGNLQPLLPSDQWTWELSNWFDASLARLQLDLTQYAVGPSAVLPGMKVLNPDVNTLAEAMCYSQLVKATQGTVSFSMLGIIIIFVVGGVIVVLSLTLDPLVGWYQVRYKKGIHRRLNWVSDSFFQLQRMAYEKSGMGEWDGHHDNVPVTKRVDTFGGWSDVDTIRPTVTNVSSKATKVDDTSTSEPSEETETKPASRVNTQELASTGA